MDFTPLPLIITVRSLLIKNDNLIFSGLTSSADDGAFGVGEISGDVDASEFTQ